MLFLPSIQGVIKRRLLVNFRVDPEVIQRLLPEGLEPKLQGEHAVAGICLIRLERMRPAGVPVPFGLSSENAAHRVAVRWHDSNGDSREGVFIPRRHTNSSLILAVGGRVFPSVHRRARFDVRDSGEEIRMSINAIEDDMKVILRARACDELPAGSVFPSLEAASDFFRGGSVGYSPAREPEKLEGLRLIAPEWRVAPLHVSEVHSSWFADEHRFPSGSAAFDCALVMRDVEHRWQPEPALAFQSRDPLRLKSLPVRFP
jgi:Uncharacterized conserved protein (COG2071)